MLKNKRVLLSLICLVVIIVIFCFIKLISSNESMSGEEKKKITKELISFISKNRIIEWDQYQTDIDFSKVSAQQKLDYAYHILNDEYYSFEKEVSAVIFENLFEKVFGDTNFEHQNLNCSVCGKELLTYDKEKQTYKYSDKHLGHGRIGLNVSMYNSYNKPLELSIVKDKYKLTVAKIIAVGYDTGRVYGSSKSDDGTLLFEYGIDIKTMEEIVKKFEDNYKEYENRLIKYVYIFVKKNNEFFLTNYEIVD